MDNRPIGIFDSGVGGLTAVRRLIQEAPNESIVYFGDNLRAPYGDRTVEEIRTLSVANARFLRARDVKALIIACNTSTASAMDVLASENADIPTAGTVRPTAEEAVRLSTGGRIGVIATTATIRSGLYEKTIRALRPDAEVLSLACPKLVPLVESGHREVGDSELMAALREYMEPFRAAEVDTMVLGCTHYPLIEDAILTALGRETVMVDSGGACASAVLRELREKGALADGSAPRRERYYCSGSRERFASVARGFLGRDILALTHVAELKDER